MKQETELLVQAACSGNEEALSNLLAVCQPDLKRFARRTCSTSQDAEDAVQVALWQLHRKIGALRTVAAFAGWLFKIIERECYRLFKVGARTEKLPESFNDDMVAPFIDTHLHIDLTQSIAALPPNYRAVLILRDIEELTAPEVAEQLEISLEAVKSRLHRARAMVRDDLIHGGYIKRNSKSDSEINTGD